MPILSQRESQEIIHRYDMKQVFTFVFIHTQTDPNRIDLEVGELDFKNAFMADVDNNICNVVYRFQEFWPTDYFPAYPKLMRRILPLHYTRVFNSEFTPDSSIPFSRDELNVCVHIRLGDWVPTSADRFILQLKLFFKYVDINIPINVHVFYQLDVTKDDENSRQDEAQVKIFTDFFAEFKGAKLTLRKNTPMEELIDLLLMSDVLMASESSISTHLSVMAQRPMVFAKPGFGEGNARGCLQAEHICMHRDAEGIRDPWVEAYANELSTRYEVWDCVRDYLNGIENRR
jgi:hypothetical protein